ncbi:protein crumbs-like isoform X2 [Mercenaria mercenaria]|uniref:protein crumbs-like isoform X2 n=1 Tax=Mercenaria mercenaria TaxID=6596 RepID=UPI00234E86D6|nr:protein crumbs-like isoform X2 [Mercenaria mercenaria]XP_053380725.1 protein crumbs-like isoform X2 [Mercenaria mercenaria]XP_053380726.1 protein crumbs-like isoform X2 [Mercenaria mercenaria]
MHGSETNIILNGEKDYQISFKCEKCSDRALGINGHVRYTGSEKIQQKYMCNRLMSFCGFLCIIFLLDHGLVRMAAAQENGDINDCYSHPCNNGGTCIDGENTYTCQCPHLYNGTNCENDLSVYGCAVSPCLNGGTCQGVSSGTRNYRCDCLSGFAGTNCEGNIDECGTNPCHNDVPCIDKVGGYECNCTGSGYSGSLCDQDIDECEDTSVCGTGQCFNNPGSFTCGCQDGFFGPECQDIDECQSNPCQNGATCQNLENRYKCLCVTGYTGGMCETDIDNCINITCGGLYSECRDGVNSHTCVCKPGYTGVVPNCVEIDECQQYSPCRNGATCRNLINDYNCTCVLGYGDKNCSTNIDECSPNPCMNGATCTDLLNDYRCDCLAGFNGNQCENNIDECAFTSHPCSNGGTCVDEIDGYSCRCVFGYTGASCQTDINECSPNPCGVNSTDCTDGIGYFNCTCKLGYTGVICQTDIDECSSNPCQNGAICTNKINGYECACTADWMGMDCSVQYDACSPVFQNCKNGATCASTPPSHDFSCTCVRGFTGSQCETNIDDCTPDPCEAPLVCFDKVDGHLCGCPIGFEGVNCSTPIDECGSSPCQNGGTCIDGIGNYTCQCNQRNASVIDGTTTTTYLTGYDGVNCENDINECLVQPSICLNGGDCENEDGTFQCKCGRDSDGNYFSGYNCEVSTSYCTIHQEVTNDQPACKNNGTCRGLVNDFVCDCAPGFTGRRCKTNIDECESNPCQYNGTCVDGINGYTCDCIPGITGKDCETNIDECASNPCLHAGKCIDHINSFGCNCTDTGFKGDTCDINIDDCEPKPCENGATCYDLIKDYNCTCFPGYNGKECQNDINECASTPCKFNSTCLQKSNKTLYDIDHPGFENLTFSYANASGYLCECVAGSKGVNCEINIDDCQHDNCNNGTCYDLLNAYRCDCFPGFEGEYCNVEIDECARYLPCRYGSRCTDKIADYECECPPLHNGKPYAGKNCTFELTACRNHQCHNGATCQPYLINETRGIQDYECLCTEGFTGKYCNISTTMSFDSGSYIEARLNMSVDVTVSFRFRTTLQESILFAWIGQNGSLTRLFTTVELKEGKVFLGYHGAGADSLTNSSITDRKLNDGNWHKVVLTKTNSKITVLVTGSKCVSGCNIEVMYDSTIQSTQEGYFGGLTTQTLHQQTVSKTKFVGCMEDVTIRGTRLSLDINTVDHNFINLTRGCPRSQQCFSDTCNSKGDCVDLWNKYRCDCYRPNLGDRCETAYIAATFGYNNIPVSTAEFSLVSDIRKGLLQEFDISFFLRSRKESSLIFFFGDLQTFVTLELESGHLKVRLKFCSLEKIFLSNDDGYSDGQQHLVKFYRKSNIFMFYADENLVHAENVPDNCNFNAQYLYFGGNIPQTVSGRKKRQTIITDENVGDFSAVSPYKGTIQDVQLDQYSLQFYPLADPSLSDLLNISVAFSSGLTQNEVTDPVCDMITPCENNSTCTDVFFNDYRCECLLGYRGKNCSELDFCVTGTCPDGSTCQSLLDGFECISNATFNGETSYAVYTHTLANTTKVRSFSFKFRTLAMNGYIFMIGNNSRYFRTRLVGSDLTILYKLDDSEEMVLTASYPVSDSRWFMAKVADSQDTVTLTLYDLEGVNLFTNVSGKKRVNSVDMNDLVKSDSNEIFVGTRVLGVSTVQNIFAYEGCLSELRIGGILLPFFPDDQFVNNTSQQKFLLQGYSFTHGCRAGQGCNTNQCRHSSTCIPDFYTYVCNCSTGYTGRWCQDRVDYCEEDQCVNGHCENKLDNYECVCPSGYTGDRCDTDVNECNSNVTVCQNNASCQNENGTYTCQCSQQFIGDMCEISLTVNCSTNPCVHGTCAMINTTHPVLNTQVETFNCTCNAGYEGYRCDSPIDYCSNFPCENGGICESHTDTQTYTCNCPTGFSGDRCEENINDCPSQYCKNRGVCVDGVNSFVCNCTQFYTGPTCETDIDECEITRPCQHEGACINTQGSPGFSCICSGTGFEGLYCEHDVDECTSSPGICQNGAACNNTVGGYECTCTLGYKGKNCEIPDCGLISCQNSGTCRISQSKWNCLCPQFYEGDLCEIKGPCADEPCLAANTEQCTQNVTANTYNCQCRAGWKGQICSEDQDECVDIAPCQNGATCINNQGSFRCDCVLGYTDQYCQTNIDECESSPCKNNGYCFDGIGQFECNCTGTGYENLTCEVDVDECADNNPCYNGAACKNTVGSYQCQCTNGFEGKNCEVKSDALMEDDITWYIVGPVVALVLILITIGIIWFLLCVRNKRATRGAYSPSRQEVTGSRVELGNVMKKPPLERLI